MNAVLYARYSPRPDKIDAAGNVKDVDSIETQVQMLKSFCGIQDMPIIETLTDAGLSGKDMKDRPGLQRALELACHKDTALVVYSLSRLARSTRDAILMAEMLEKAGAHLISLTEKIDTTSPMGRVFYKFIAIFAEFEREMTSQRTSEAMLEHQKNGRVMSRHTIFGFARDPENRKLMVEVPGEQAVIRIVMSLRGQGMSWAKIAKELEEKGVACRGNPHWHPATIGKIINRNS